MKTIFVENNIVVGLCHIPDSSPAVASAPTGSIPYEVADTDTTRVGYSCTVTNGTPVFTAPAPVTYPPLSAYAFSEAFSAGEAVAIKNSADPIVQDFWQRIQIALTQSGTTVDPESAAIIAKLTYLSTAAQNPSAESGVGVYLPGSMTPVPKWTAGAAVTAGQSLAVGNAVYTYTTAGTTAASGMGPAGTGAGISDGSAACSFEATPYIAPSRIPQIQAGIAQ